MTIAVLTLTPLDLNPTLTPPYPTRVLTPPHPHLHHATRQSDVILCKQFSFRELLPSLLAVSFCSISYLVEKIPWCSCGNYRQVKLTTI